MSTRFSPSMMSGDFDFPPATTGSARLLDDSRSSTIDPRVTSRSNLTSPNSSIHPLDPQTENDLRRMIIDSEYRHHVNLRGSTRRQHLEDHSAMNQNLASNLNTRPRVWGSRLRRRVTASYNSHTQRPSFNFGPATFGLDLPAPPLPQFGNPDMASAEYSGEAEVNRRRKRVKLNDDQVSPKPQGFKYAWSGRAKPGPLKMEIHECDGGINSEVPPQHCHQYKQDNVLVNDQSVYCTETNRCNIILRHMDEACFNLTKLVVKAPEKGFTAPIQEGLVFVGMHANELVIRTLKYRLQAASRLDHHFRSHSRQSSLSISDLRPSSRRRDSLVRNVPPPISDTIPRTVPLQNVSSPQQHHLEQKHLADTTLAAPGFRVTTHCNEVSDDEEEESSPQTLADRYNREHMTGSFFPASSDDEEETVSSPATASFEPPPTLHQRDICRRRGERRNSPSRIEVPDDRDTTSVLPPHAKFFIERDRSVVSIAFDPPVAGKFILLKLFGPHEHQNIDIQSISAHGYAGPRLFPAQAML